MPSFTDHKQDSCSFQLSGTLEHSRSDKKVNKQDTKMKTDLNAGVKSEYIHRLVELFLRYNLIYNALSYHKHAPSYERFCASM